MVADRPAAWAALLLMTGVHGAMAQEVSITAEAGGYVCRTAQYQARIGADGSIASLQAGGVELLGGAGFVNGGALVPLRAVTQPEPGVLVAEGDPRDPDTAVAASKCPFNARISYRFLPDRVELTLEQSMEQRGRFAWLPSDAVVASRDSLTDYPTPPQGPFQYGQTDPRWTTDGGPVLRFDFGVWQRGFANANWGSLKVGEASVNCMFSTTIAARAMPVVIHPLAHPGAGDALSFDISAASPDFLMPGGEPVHFDITVINTGPDPIQAPVCFEVRDYLTQQPIASRPTQLRLESRAQQQLPTDLPLTEPGPYRAAIVIGDANAPERSFWWVFTYDFAHYHPPDTRAEDFEQFWADALAESAATPLDIRMEADPSKSTDRADAFRISYATLSGRRIYGWYSRPKAPGTYPAHIRFPSSGIYPLRGPEMYADRCSLWIVIHGFDVDLSNLPAGDDPGKSYWTAGIESPQTSMWRTIYISLVRAVDFMLAQDEVDAGRVVVTGGSQGGGLSMVAAALDHRIGLCLPSHSGLPRLDWTVTHAPGYWPFSMDAKPEGQSEEQFLRTLSYFDPANFTADIRCPVAAEIGLMDTVTAAGNQVCALAHVPDGLLYLVCSPWAMHGGGSRDSSLIRECYNRYLRGEEPISEATRP